jgi:hypothetical protein
MEIPSNGKKNYDTSPGSKKLELSIFVILSVFDGGSR